MTAAILKDIKLKEIRELKQKRKIPKRNLLRIFGRKISKLAENVENNWSSFPKERQEELKKWAYEVNKVHEITWKRKIRNIAILFSMYITGQYKDYSYFISETDNLIDCVLNAIESSDVDFQKSIILEATKITQLGEETEISSNDRDRLRKISDQIFSEL